MKTIYITVILLILGGCAYYPKKVEIYDTDCNIQFKKLILEKDNTNMRVKNCENEACIASLLAIPMQAFVAGSIVVAGNVVYWLEKEGKCLLKDEI
jgi:hypothetical protein